ncbi:unnamed protein product [Rotaria sordida]|uniref:F-box domain-containing protein n=1 Tax=Rotaria sordida TaxID=392033 RepID=A0A819NM58_9BILA|nr:unnamed protein product [Rotaria sordida]CAF1247895.1 unnamed protein product [Rotaria sordida]CAF3867214.1 unnamed protein product [Rotaria sordida]CAF3998666.1 unnamed protein product [Rotaria sordida]
MEIHFEHFPNELLIDIFEYLDARDLFYGFWGLNKRFNHILQSLKNISLTMKNDESKLISLFAPQIKRLIVDTCLNIDLTQFPHLHSLILLDLTETQLRQIQSEFMPHLVYISISPDNKSCILSQLIQRIFSQTLSSLRCVNLGCVRYPVFHMFQSYVLQSITINCTSSITVPYILLASPNLSNLRVHFEENNFNIFYKNPTIPNHPLKYFILSDPYGLLCFKHVDTFLTYMPNLKRIKLNFNCDVLFIQLAKTVATRLICLNRFDCHIDNTSADAVTSIDEIQQIHPCFVRIRCITGNYGYRIYKTD